MSAPLKEHLQATKKPVLRYLRRTTRDGITYGRGAAYGGDIRDNIFDIWSDARNSPGCKYEPRRRPLEASAMTILPRAQDPLSAILYPFHTKSHPAKNPNQVSRTGIIHWSKSIFCCMSTKRPSGMPPLVSQSHKYRNFQSAKYSRGTGHNHGGPSLHTVGCKKFLHPPPWQPRHTYSN